MKAKSIKGKTTAAVKAETENSMADGLNPTLAICFISKSLGRKAITEFLDQTGIAVYGCTTNGEFIDEEPEIPPLDPLPARAGRTVMTKSGTEV